MKRTEDKKRVIAELQSQGIDFSKDVFTLDGRESTLLNDAAKRMNYRRSKTSYLSNGHAFFEHLKKVMSK